MKSILITGAFGQLGIACSNILESTFNIIKTGINANRDNSKLDVSSKKDVEIFLNLHKPDIILNLAALTDVDGCEQDPQRADKINREGVMHLCDGFSGHFIQLSTDYVFDGEDGPYLEDDLTNPISIYGKTKLEAETYLINSTVNYTIIRTNVVYSYSNETKASFLKWVVQSLKDSKHINVVSDQWNNPTSAESLAHFIQRIALYGIHGLYHYADEGLMSRYEFAKLIAKTFELDSDLIRPILTSELNQAASRPLKSGLSTQKVQNELSIVPPSVEKSLIQICNSLK